ncbi:MAG: hypothetical protein GY747_08925 [Planctomycetes bacterium]|nr:hypothetical protein [Planctomycetota bacterium]
MREKIYDYLKEAMQLAAEGFVEILPRRGVRVVPLTIERIRDYYEILAALEGTALRNAGLPAFLLVVPQS